MPGASYCESLARLAGLLADVPFALEWHVPREKVITDCRVTGRPRRRSRRRRPRRAAHPEHPRTPAALETSRNAAPPP